MQLINNKIRLVELAKELEVTPEAIMRHVKKPDGLGLNSEKLGGRQTGDLLLSIDSVLKWLDFYKGRKGRIKLDTLLRVEETVRCLIKP